MNILYQIADTFWQTQNNMDKQTFMLKKVRRNYLNEHCVAEGGLVLIDTVGMGEYEDLTNEEVGQIMFGN